MKSNEFTELRPCLDYIYKNFGKEVFFSGRLTAYVKDLGPSLGEFSIIRLLEKENILKQIESIGSMDINDRNLLVNDIIYKLPIHLNKDAFRNTLEIIIFSMGVDLGNNKNTSINPASNESKIIYSKNDKDKSIDSKDSQKNRYDEVLDEETRKKVLEIFKDDIDAEVKKIQENNEGKQNKNSKVYETPAYNFDFDKKTGKIKRYLGTSTNVIIPAKIDGVQVKKIGDYSFAYGSVEDFKSDKECGLLPYAAFFNHCTRIENVEIPQGVETIGRKAFLNNIIEFLKLPNSIKSIEFMAFEGNQIKELTLGEDLEFIGHSAFSGNKIETLCIPTGVKSIENLAFRDNQIKEMTLGESVESIGNSAFSDNKIESLSLPKSIKSIDRWAFYSNQIKELTLGENLESIGSLAFSRNKIETLNIPASVKSIGDFAFSGNQIKELTLGESLESIGSSAFSDNKIEILNVPASVKSIDSGTFSKNQIKELTLGESLESIGKLAFCDNKIEILNIPASVKSIDDSAFRGNQIKKLTLGESLESIGSSAFRNNKIESLSLPKSIKSIESKAFINNNIKDIFVPDEIENIDKNAFDKYLKVRKKSFFDRFRF